VLQNLHRCNNTVKLFYLKVVQYGVMDLFASYRILSSFDHLLRYKYPKYAAVPTASSERVNF